MHALRSAQHILSYHDRSDGGLLTTLCEMAFAGRTGLDIDITALGDDPIASLFNEELGVVVQIKQADSDAFMACLAQHELADCTTYVGQPDLEQNVRFFHQDHCIYENTRGALQQCWASTSYHLQALRDNAVCAEAEYNDILRDDAKGLMATHVTFNIEQAPFIHKGHKPKVAILREQGVNGHMEMAAAFMAAGFDCQDVHISDLLEARADLSQFNGLACCGGFSYGDVLGAGVGWAQVILEHSNLLKQFQQFFERPNTFTFGACNGCQMVSQLHHIIPGAVHWPSFSHNASEQYEARLVLVQVRDSPSVLLTDMQSAILPIVVSHGEGRATWMDDKTPVQALQHKTIALRYVDDQGEPTIYYPHNPNGSTVATAGVTSKDGRVTIMMPHPERVYRSAQCAWAPRDWGQMSPWYRLFNNARAWLN